MNQPTQSSESRSLLAILLCVVFYLGFQQYMDWKYPKPKVTASSTLTAPGTPSTTGSQPTVPAVSNVAAGNASGNASSGAGSGNTVAPIEAIARLSAADLVLETDRATWKFSQDLGALTAVSLKDYKADNSKNSPAINLVDFPMILQGTLNQSTQLPSQAPFSAERHGNTIQFSRSINDILISQEFTISQQGYSGSLKVVFANHKNQPVDLTGGLLMQETLRPKKSDSIMGILPGTVTAKDQVLYRAENSSHWTEMSAFCKPGEAPISGNDQALEYFGIDRHYFLTTILPKGKTSSFKIERLSNTDLGCTLGFLSYNPLGTLQPGESVTLDYDLFFGPKAMDTLTEVNPLLVGAMHLGFFDFIARPLLVTIDGFYKVLKNYGLAIICLTIVLKILFYPLVRASQISMHNMKKFNPEMQAIREKWKDDRARQQQELMKFMSKHKINPMKGCLPILPQIPVFFAFYQVLQTSIHLRHAPFFGWIQDLSSMDPFLVTPLLMGVAMFAQQKLTPTTGMDKTQEKILMFMPVMFTAMMLTLPAGLTLYMLTNTVVGIGQTKWLTKRLNQSKPSLA